MDIIQQIDNIITDVDALMDAHGIQKAVMGVGIVQKLKSLQDELKAEEQAHKNDMKGE